MRSRRAQALAAELARFAAELEEDERAAAWLARRPSVPFAGVCPLSRRQLQVLGVFASGEVASAKEAARVLGVELKTVRNHVDSAARAAGTSGLTQTLVVALQRGWVRLPGGEAEAA